MKRSRTNPRRGKFVEWSWIALVSSALHFGGDLFDNRAYVFYVGARGLPINPAQDGLPTDSAQFIGVVIFSLLLYTVFGLGIIQASRGSRSWLVPVFLLDILWAAVGNGAVGLVICSPPCGWRYIPTGNLQDIGHIASLISGTVASLSALNAWNRSAKPEL